MTTLGDSGLRISVEPGSYRIDEIEREGGLFRSVRVFGAGRLAIPGRPDLPVRGYWVAVPDGHTIRARVIDTEYDDLPGPPVEPAPRDTIVGGTAIQVESFDPVLYGSARWYPEETVTVGETSRLRHQNLVPLRVRFFRTVPATGMLRVYRKMEIEIEFVPDRSKRPARPMERSGDEGEWERIYRGTVVNYDQARSFRTRAARSPAAFGKGADGFLDEYKIRVDESGLYRLDYTELADAGFPAGVSFSSLAIERRDFSEVELESGGDPFTAYSIPFHEIDSNGDGLFGEGDRLVTWLPGFREDRPGKDYDDRFAYEAVYFLSVEAERETMPERDGSLGFAGLTPRQSFADSIRWEVDVYYNINTPIDTVDLYFAIDQLRGSRVTEIELPPVDAAGSFGVKAMTVSTVASATNNYHHYRLIEQASGDTVFNETVFGERGALFPSEQVLSASSLVTGINRFLYEGSRGRSPDETTVTGAGGFLDWYEIHANFLYRAVDDYLLFSSGDAGGPVEMEIEGFTSAGILVFDVSDPDNPVRIRAAAVPAGDGSFTATIQDSAGAPKRYAAATAEGARPVSSSRIEADRPTSIASEEAVYLIVAWDEFADAARPLADHRASRGITTKVVNVSDVYDEFNGGVKDPQAIYRYLKHGFLRWSAPPLGALLVGDGYEDYKDIATNHEYGDYDYVPAHPIYQPNIEGGGDHWDVSDNAHVFFDGDSDALPELLIGRLPGNSVDEIALMVEKTIEYEEIAPGDDWRSRAMFLADDTWTFESGPIEDRRQVQFEGNSNRFAEELKEGAARGIDTVKVFVSRYTDIYHPLCPYATYPDSATLADVDCTIEMSRQGVTDRFFDEVNGAGVGLINFEGHGNRNVLTHEIILRNGPDYRNNTSQDIRERSDHEGRPYIFMAYGCSISEFDRFKSFGWNSIPEEMMVNDRGGAVATFGSTGIEFLTPNLILNESVLKYIYKMPGVVPGAAAGDLAPWYDAIPRWTLGEMFSLGMMDFIVNQGQRPSVVRRYELFGDPFLAVDARPPHFEVTVDGEPAEDGGSLLGNPDGTAVRIVARLHDEVLVDSASVKISEGGSEIDRSLYTVERDDSIAADGRAWRVTYEPEIRFGEYDVTFSAVDGAGREGTFTLKVFVDVSVTFDGLLISDGDYVSREPLLRAEITTPVPVSEDEIVVEIDGAPLEIDTLRQIDQFRWLASSRPLLADGEHELRIAVQGLDKICRFRVEDRLRIVDLLNWPNPTELSTGVYYSLTDFADQVRLEVYTVSGKRIRSIGGLSGRAGYNSNPDVWDGNDQDGDRVANGVYLYRLVASKGGERAEAIGKAVLTR